MSRFGFRTRNGVITSFIQGIVGTTIDVDAQAFFDRVTAAGGTLSTTEKDAVNSLTLQLKENNIWTLMNAIYPMVGASAAACAQNLKSSSHTGTFSSGWTFSNNGVLPNGTSAFFNTGLNTNTTLVKTSAHISLYARTNSNAGQPYDIGNATNPGMVTDNTILQIRYNNNIAYFSIADSGTYSPNVSSTDSRGFWCGTRISNTQFLYKNGTQIATASAGSGNLANNNLFIGAANNGGTANFFSDKQYAFSTIGAGLSGVQTSNFYSIVQAFQTSLSRQV